MFRKKRVAALALSALMASTMLSGCSGGNDAASNIVQDDPAAASGTYPMETDTTLTYWMAFGEQSQLGVTNAAEMPGFQELEKETGVKIEFTHPTDQEQTNLMLASGEYPDLIEGDFYNYPGGPEKAISDEVLTPLNELMEKYAPNLTSYLEEHPDVNKQVQTDEGNYYVFPFLRGDKSLQVFQGPMIRKDWLDQLGLAVPETIDEWHTALTAFKEQLGVSAPLSFDLNTLSNSAFIAGAYGVRDGLYVEDGQVKYGQAEPGYKEYLTTMRQWYEEGLIDRNFATVDAKILDANMMDSQTGATVGNTGGALGKWLAAMESVDPNFNLVPTKYPTLEKGDKVSFSQYDVEFNPAMSVGITTQCKNPAVAARWLDYGYSEAGHMHYNFGIEGVSYEMIDGYPTYTEVVTNNPEGKAMSNMLSYYCKPNGGGPYVQDPRYMVQYSPRPQQQESLVIWADTNADQTTLPRVTLTPEESEEAADIRSDLDTYTKEMFASFIMGSESLDNYDTYLEQLKTIGVERYVELYQGALERYNQR